MRPSDRRKYRVDDEPSPRENRELVERGEWIEEDDEEVVKKAPMPLRLLAWVSLIAIFFAIGYGATSLIFKWMDDRGGRRHPDNIVVNRQEAEKFITETKSADETVVRDDSVLCTLSIPDGDSFSTRQIRCSRGIREDNMQQTLSAYLDAVKEGKLLDPAVQSLNIFQSGDWLYINMNGSFMTSLKALGADKSRLLLTGLVKTMSDNFSPISKVKFYIDGSETKGKDPVDLSMPWGLSGRS